MLCRYPPNPVRARLFNFLQDNRWSSYHANAQGKADQLLTPYAGYFIRQSLFRLMSSGHD